jgi:RHS repeat-associated protein
VDERFTRTTASKSDNYLTDALGSTLALTDTTGAINTQYSYEAYGNTTQSGTTSDNAYQYTGRENDGTGLYYYRARYYDTQTSRFISQDPIGFGGGVNQFAYVHGNPISLVDPLGLDSNNPPICKGTDCVNPAYDVTKNGPKPSPSMSQPTAKSSIWDFWKPKKYDEKGCSSKQPTFQTCMACCQAEAQCGKGGTGNPCRLNCMSTAYPDNPYGANGL